MNTKNELRINGTQKFMGIDIPIVEGGFSEKCRVVSAKTIAEIHETRLKEINQSINRLIKKGRFTENIDYIDLFSNEIFKVTASDLGLITSNGQKQCFIVSERGYTKLAKYMDDDKSWDVMEQFVDEYFTMREVIKSNEQQKAQLLLSIYDGGKNAVLASKQLTELEVKEATAPLIAENAEMKPKADYHDEVLKKDGLITTTVVAKDLGFSSANKLNKVMNANHIIFKNQSGTWCPYADYEWLIEENYADYESYTNEHSKPCLKWTEKGRKWIVENYNKWVMKLVS